MIDVIYPVLIGTKRYSKEFHDEHEAEHAAGRHLLEAGCTQRWLTVLRSASTIIASDF